MTDSQENEPTEPSLMMPGEAAKALGVTTTTLATWALKGMVESVLLPSGHRRYVAASVRRLVAKESA